MVGNWGLLPIGAMCVSHVGSGSSKPQLGLQLNTALANILYNLMRDHGPEPSKLELLLNP